MPKKTVNNKKNHLKSNQRGLKRKNSKLLKKGLKTPNKVRKVKRTKGTKRRKRGRKIKTGGAGRSSGRRSMERSWRQSNEFRDAGDQRRRRQDEGFQIRGNKRADRFAKMRALPSEIDGMGNVGDGNANPFKGAPAADIPGSNDDGMGNVGDGIANQAEGDMGLIVDEPRDDGGNTNDMPVHKPKLEPPGVVLHRIIIELSSDYPILRELGELGELERLFEEAVVEEYPITAYFEKLENKFVESSQEELVGASNIQEFATGAAEKAEIIAKLLLKFREKYEGDTTGGDSASATNGEEAYIFTKILSRQDQVYPFNGETYIDKINLSLLQIYIEKIVDKYDLDPGKVEESEDAGSNKSRSTTTTLTKTLTGIISLGVQELLLNCMFDKKSFRDSVKENPDFGSNLNKNLLNLLVLLISYQKKDDIDDIVDIGPANLEYEAEMINYLTTYSTDLTSAIRLLIKNNGDFVKAEKELISTDTIPNILPEVYIKPQESRKQGGGNKKQKGGAGVVLDPKIMALFVSLANAIDTDDFNNDSKHDNLTTTNFSGENDAIKDAKLQGGEKGSLFNKLNENGRFIKVDMKTGISSETPLEGLESINFLVDAGGGFFKGLPDKDPCTGGDPSVTNKYISNYTDPASTGKGLLYRCFTEIGGGGTNSAINGADKFIGYCIAFTREIITRVNTDKRSIDGVNIIFYETALNFLEQVTVDAITGDKFKCSSRGIQFDWLGNQSIMAHWINDTTISTTPLAAPRSSNTVGYNDIKKAYDLYLANTVAVEYHNCVLALCRILKYMGDKSHIVAAVLMIKLKEQPFIIQTIDRLLAKCVVQVVEYCRTNPEYQFISQNLGVMLTNARKAPVITHTLACYNDVSGNNECKGTESAIFTYYTSDPVAIKIKWIDSFLESYENTIMTAFPSDSFSPDYKSMKDENLKGLITTIKGSREYDNYKSELERIKLEERIKKITKLSKILPLTFSEGRSGIRLQNGPVVKAHYFTQLSKFNELLSLTLETINEKKEGDIVGLPTIKNLAKQFKTSYDNTFDKLSGGELVTISNQAQSAADATALLSTDPAAAAAAAAAAAEAAEAAAPARNEANNKLKALNMSYNFDKPEEFNLQLQIFQNALGYGRGSQQLPIQVYTVHPGLSGLASSSAKKYAGQVAKSYVDELTSIYELCCKLEQAPATAPAPEAPAGQEEGMEE